MQAAIERLTASLAIEPNNIFALSNRAYAYSRNAERPKALVDAASAIRVSPTYVDMYDLRAWIFASRGEEDAAIKEINAMLAASPDSVDALRKAARNYWILGRYPDAVAAADKVVAREPTAQNYLHRANSRDPADVVNRMADVDAALAKKPGFPPAVAQRAVLLSLSGDHKGAIAAYTAQLKTVDQMPAKRWFWTLRGIEYAKDAQTAASAKDFAAALSDNPDGDSYNNFCWTVALARVNLEGALAACEKAVAIAPKDPAYLDSKGFALLQLGRFDEAILAYDGSLAAKPDLSASLYGRGLAKKRRCNCDAGEADMKAGRSEDPNVVHTFAEAGLKP
jgi:tetratricopeptide (TPR) repeat protein